MDSNLSALESGLLAPPDAVASPAPLLAHAEVARRWAAEQGLRPGTALGPSPAALAPLVARWAEERGWPAPSAAYVGRGLNWAGLIRRRRSKVIGPKLVAMHPADAARLWAAVRQAWAPKRAPGDERGRNLRGRRRKEAVPTTAPKELLGTWAEELRRLPRHLRRPVCDSTGRVWPSPSVVARALGGNRKAVDNAMRGFREALHGPEVETPKALLQAMRKGGVWRGRWWRYLTPEEAQSIPPTHPAGTPLPGYGWGLQCACCGGHATYPTADLPPRPW